MSLKISQLFRPLQGSAYVDNFAMGFFDVLKALWEKLPRLESIVYELWRVRRRHYQKIACAHGTFNLILYFVIRFCVYTSRGRLCIGSLVQNERKATPPSLYRTHISFPSNISIELASLLQHSVPIHVKKVSIFKDFNPQLTLALDNATAHLGLDIDIEGPTTSAVDAQLAKAFAAKSQHLEHLSISFMIDAQQFLTACQLQDQQLPVPCTMEPPVVADTHIMHTGPENSSSKCVYTTTKRQFNRAEDAAAENHGAVEH
jgi:hypothetical protein